MTDVLYVASAYLVVVGGLALYVLGLMRRIRAARVTSAALHRERSRGDDQPAAPVPASRVEPAKRAP